MSNSTTARRALHRHADKKKAVFLLRFFKTGKGEYGYGDVFIGVVVPKIRRVAREFRDLPLSEVKKLLRSKIHEERLMALVILTHQFARGDEALRETIYRLYLGHSKWINNWDLVDVSARQIVGGYLIDKDRSILRRLVHSKLLWDRRIAVIATFEFIRNRDFKDCLELCKTLLNDKQDLMHKACGWMLREVGKRDQAVLEGFLRKHAHQMPRVMLRYAIEKLSPSKRRHYLGLRSAS